MTDRTVVYRIQADVKQAQAQMAALGASVKKSAGDMTAATKEGAKFRGGLDTLGNTAGKIGLVAAVGLGAAVKKAADFDAAMSDVQAATHESAAAMESLRQAALDAGAETAFSATEAAAGIENLAKAGVSTAEILNGGLNGALALAAAGEMEVADAAEAAAGAMAQFGLSGDQVPHIADLLAAAAGKAQGDVSDFTMALKQGGTVAAQTGLSLEETTGALAAMAEQSLLGSDAGTSFKTMLASLTPNSDKAAKAMEQYNIHAFDAQGNFVGMTELAGQLESGLGHLTDEQRAMALETIFGSDAVRAASIIYDNGAEGVAKWTAEVNDAGFAAETAAIKQDNLRGDIEKLGGALETALIGTGDGAQGPLRSLVQSLEGAVNAYNDLGDGAKSGVGIALAATATLGGGLFVFSKVVQSVSATRDAMDALGITSESAASKMKLLGPAIAVVAGASLATLADDLGDVDYSIGEMGRQLELIAAQGDAAGVLEDLSFSADTLGEALRDAAWNDFNAFGLGASDEIKELDAALAGLDPTVAGEVFKTILEDGQAAGLSVKEITALFPQYAAELKLVAAEQAAGAGAADEYAAATQDLSSATGRAEEAAERFTATLEGLNAVLDGRSTFRDYEAAIDEMTQSLKENGRTFDITTGKGRANQAALDNIASSALNVAETLSDTDRRKFLSTAIQDLRTMGNSMGLPKREIDALIALLKQANRTDVKPNISVDTGAAMTGINNLEARLNAIADEDVFVNIRHRSDGRDTGFGPVREEATGGYIAGPGTSTSDSIPAYLSNGEYVIKAAAVEKYGTHMFDGLNAMRFAGGGKVKKKGLSDPVRDDSMESTTNNDGFLSAMYQMVQQQAQAAARQENAAQIALQAAEDQAKAAEDNLSAAEGQLSATQQLRDSLASSVSSQFSGSLTGGGLSGLMSTLGRDINAGSSMTATLQALTAAGLDTTGASAGLFQELAASSDLTTANQLLAAGPEMIAMLEAQYAQRESINQARGEFAAEQSYSAMIAQQTATVAAAQQQVAQLQTIVAQRDAQHAQSTAQVQALTQAVQAQAEQFAGALNGAANQGVRMGRGSR